MAKFLESFEIDSPEYGRPFKIDLAEGLDDPHIDFIEQKWEPILERQHNLALLNFFQLPSASQTQEKWAEIQMKFGCGDSHWRWRAKCKFAPGTNRQIYGLLNAGDVEAAMCLLFGKLSRDAKPQPIVYVDFVAVAPWSRIAIQDPQRFKKLGTVMLGAAVETSISMGLEGRCGLHSLTQSEGFYRRIGMNDFGVDAAYSSLRYFEFTEQSARKFIGKGAP